MGRYRVTTTVVYEIESALEHVEAVKIVEAELDAALGDKDILRRQVKLEKLRERRCNIQLGVFAPEDVIPYICRDEMKREYTVNGKTYTVRMNSQRYFIFRESLCCAACGLQGTKMILEQNPTDKSPHFNLYGEEFGRLVLLTKDHVRPKAFGGEDRHSNYQTMCAVCNNLKGHAKLTLQGIAELRNLYNENRQAPRKKLRTLLDEAKKNLALPHTTPKINKSNRKQLQAQLKANASEPLIANIDLHVWKTSDGSLVGRSVYEHELHGAELLASVKAGTALVPVSSEGTRILIKLSETESFLIYQGYLDYKEEMEDPKPEAPTELPVPVLDQVVS